MSDAMEDLTLKLIEAERQRDVALKNVDRAQIMVTQAELERDGAAAMREALGQLSEQAEALMQGDQDDWGAAFTVIQRALASDAGRAYAERVGRMEEALRLMVTLWDDNHPDDKCACLGASEDCKNPPPCELCCARAALEGKA